MKTIIYGSTGFIGSSLMKCEGRNQSEFVGFSRKNTDMLNPKSIVSNLQQVGDFESIIFCAGPAPVKDIESFDCNVLLMSKFLEGIEEIAGRIKITYISSDAVYPSKSCNINEFSPAEPDSLHGRMHLAREEMLNSTQLRELLILRPTAVFGIGDTHNSFGPNRFMREMKELNQISLHGAYEELRDHIWINDLCAYVVQLEKTSVGVFNVASGVSVSFGDIVTKLEELMKSSISITQDPGERETPYDRNFHIDKLVSETNLEFHDSLDRGILDMINRWDQI